jgi:pathogenesis-related protein 1
MKRVFLLYLMTTLSAQAESFDATEMLAVHNHWRTKVGSPPLIYSPELAASSQRWADHLKVENHCRMQHSQPDGKYGENLYWASAIRWSDGKREVQQVSPQKVVDTWGNEVKDYNYALNSCTQGKMCGHYTQVVWKSTARVGCAFAVCADSSEQVWVCQYQTPGNWVGEKPY